MQIQLQVRNAGDETLMHAENFTTIEAVEKEILEAITSECSNEFYVNVDGKDVEYEVSVKIKH